MRAGRTDRKEFIAPAGDEHGVLAHVSTDHPAIRNGVQRDALRQVGPLRLGLLGGHGPSTDDLVESSGSPGRR
jgi:hypothetical protein